MKSARQVPTKKPPAPTWSILHREAAAKRIQVNLGAASKDLAESVDNALLVLLDARDTAPDTITAVVGLALFRQATEQLDASDILLSAGASRPVFLQLRAFLEAAWYAMYVLDRNDERVSAAYVIQAARTDIDAARRRAEGHAPGSRPTIAVREIESQFANFVRDVSFFQKASQELERLQQEQGSAFWYQAFGGPRSIRALAERAMGDAIVYDELYVSSSLQLHGSRGLESLRVEREGKIEFEKLRRSDDIDEVRNGIEACEILMALCVERFSRYFLGSAAGLPDRVAALASRYDFGAARKSWHNLREKL